MESLAPNDMKKLTHLDDSGAAAMVDVSAKPVQLREAVACGEIHLQRETLALIEQNQIAKGNVLATARLAVPDPQAVGVFLQEAGTRSLDQPDP